MVSSSSVRSRTAAEPASAVKRSTISRSSGARATAYGHHPHHLPLGARQVQHVLHQVAQAARLLDDDRERLPPLVLSRRAAQLERLAEEQDLGERRAQLVRDAGGEVVPEPHQLVLAAELPRGDRGEPGGEREQAEQEREPRAWARHHELTGDVRRERRAHED